MGMLVVMIKKRLIRELGGGGVGGSFDSIIYNFFVTIKMAGGAFAVSVERFRMFVEVAMFNVTERS